MTKEPSIYGTIYSSRDLYPAFPGVSTSEEMVPDDSDQQAYVDGTPAPVTASTMSLSKWAIIIVAVFVVFHIGRKEK